jgi:hypothetical protein
LEKFGKINSSFWIEKILVFNIDICKTTAPYCIKATESWKIIIFLPG